jgi:hypothetical protein
MLEVVAPAHVQLVWPDAQRFLEPMYRHSRAEYTCEQIRLYVARGEWTLLVVTEGAQPMGFIVVHVYNRPNDRVLFVQGIGGKKIVTPDVMRQLQAWGAQQGATAMECAARPSMVRLLRQVGFAPKYTVLEVPHEHF